MFASGTVVGAAVTLVMPLPTVCAPFDTETDDDFFAVVADTDLNVDFTVVDELLGVLVLLLPMAVVSVVGDPASGAVVEIPDVSAADDAVGFFVPPPPQAAKTTP